MTRWLGFSAIVLVGSALVVAPVVGGTFTADAAVAAFGFVVYSVMGGLIIDRRNGHTTGWLLALVGLAIVFANGFVLLPGVSAEAAAWVGSWGWTLVFALYALLALTFPSGHLPRGESVAGRLGRMAVWALPVLMATAPFTEILGDSETAAATSNPVGFIPGWLAWIPPLGTFLILLAAAVSLVVRRRRSQGVQRAQLAWVVFALTILVTTLALTFLFIIGSMALGMGDPGDDAWTIAFVVMTLFPTAFAVAILRYRLFEIDRIVSRTVSYAVVVGSLGLVFAAIAIGLPQLLDVRDGSAPLVAGATLAVAALFNPLRRRVQNQVDRRFNRARYDTQRELDGLAARLRDDVDLDELAGDVIAVVSRTMQPSGVSLWVAGEID
jgi:hypothetical protein